MALCLNSLAMSPSADPAAKMQKDPAARLRELPAVDELLGQPRLLGLAEKAGRGIVTQAARGVLADVRAQLKNDPGNTHPISLPEIEAQFARRLSAMLSPSLRRVINATGVILHTNLGRAPLSEDAAAQIAETATRFANLEYDIPSGERGKRDVHTAALLAEQVGAEAAIVVNNNAAAVFLVLHTLAKGAEVIVSRGELIEIGDGFRIPDIMAASGAVLCEVGTTNRTRIDDYRAAIGERTRVLMRVHPSNFHIEGFTAKPSLDELAALARERGLPLYEDLGSGCAADLAPFGISEPRISESLEAGVNLVSFSGDKLLGGPQAGLIVG